LRLEPPGIVYGESTEILNRAGRCVRTFSVSPSSCKSDDEGEALSSAHFPRAIHDSVSYLHSQITLTGTFSGTAPCVPIALSGNLSAIQIFPGVSAVTNPRGLI
jgi:hypothetical protein